jgi:hypothetical protein
MYGDCVPPRCPRGGAPGKIDALIVVRDAAADDLHLRRFELAEQSILIGQAGAHWIDHIHTDGHLLPPDVPGREAAERQEKHCNRPGPHHVPPDDVTDRREKRSLLLRTLLKSRRFGPGGGEAGMDTKSYAKWLGGIALLDPAQRARVFRELALAEASVPTEHSCDASDGAVSSDEAAVVRSVVASRTIDARPEDLLSKIGRDWLASFGCSHRRDLCQVYARGYQDCRKGRLSYASPGHHSPTSPGHHSLIPSEVSGDSATKAWQAGD